jgi:hypothetical protein
MEPLLSRLRKPGFACIFGAVPAEDTDALRRNVRFVCTSATLVGVAGRALRAAAAAAADREEFDSWRLKTAAAAVVAWGLAVAEVRGCDIENIVSQLQGATEATQQQQLQLGRDRKPSKYKVPRELNLTRAEEAKNMPWCSCGSRCTKGRTKAGLLTGNDDIPDWGFSAFGSRTSLRIS